jgi:high affinity Mn2+ porin
MLKFYLASIFLSLLFVNSKAQQHDSSSQKWNLHLQATAITQYHLPFSAKYSGINSLMTEEPARTSMTSTLYAGLRLWKNGAIYFNPEIAGGKGLSQVTGIAGFTNGETFRIGSPSIKLYLARLYLEQYFSLGKSTENVEDEANQLKGKIPLKYIVFQAGKFSISDFYDNNSLSNDPRTQFMNWSLMSTGGWDYPANTRGYTVGLSVGYHQPSFSLKAAITQVPEIANGPVLDNNIGKAFGTVVEVEKEFKINKDKTISVRVAGFYNQAHAGNYDLSVKNALANFTTPDITSTGIYSRSKAGFYINTEYNFTNGGVFLVGSWNDGKNETWAFTEIDHSISAGLSLDGKRWNRSKDVFGTAVVFNGLSKQHSNYLKQGGYGFMMGDGTLNYGLESILETYYSFQLPFKFTKVFITPNYQFVLNPAYNKDRGPVHVVALRLHVEI